MDQQQSIPPPLWGINHVSSLPKDKPAAVYLRMSTSSQAGDRRRKLIAQADRITHWLLDEGYSVDEEPWTEVALGKMTAERPVLEHAAEHANKIGGALITRDLARYVRPENYHRVQNRDAAVRPKDYNRLLKRTCKVPLYTLCPPRAAEDERVEFASRWGGKRGRPSAIKNLAMALNICTDLLYKSHPARNGRWQKSIPEVAEKHGISSKTIDNFLGKRFENGQTVRQFLDDPEWLRADLDGSKIMELRQRLKYVL